MSECLERAEVVEGKIDNPCPSSVILWVVNVPEKKSRQRKKTIEICTLQMKRILGGKSNTLLTRKCFPPLVNIQNFLDKFFESRYSPAN